MPLEFNPQAAMSYARAMARPRLAGTDEEIAAGDALARQLEGFGYRVTWEPFRFCLAVNTVIALEIIAGMVLIGLALTKLAPYWLSALGLLIPLATCRIVLAAAESAAILPDADGGSRFARLVKRLGMARAARNLVAVLPGPPTGVHRHLSLVAHYDTKSQPLPIPLRIVLFVVLFIGSVTFIGLAFLACFVGALDAAACVAGIIVIAAGIPLALNRCANHSPGAIDNASGVGVVLHLAELMAQSSELRSRLDWTILLTSAEELGLMGAAAYVKRHAADLRDETARPGVHVLNFDGVGVDGSLYYDARGKTDAGELVRLTQAAAKAQGIAVRPVRLVGALFDHIPFARAGTDALSLMAIGRASWAVHTKWDTVDRLHARGFEQAGTVAVEIIRRLAAS